MDYIRVFGIPAHNRNSRDRAELNGVTDLVIADNTPFTIIIVFDLFIQRWLSALRLDSDILDNLQNVVGKNFACSYISILDQIITGCQTCDGIRACTCSRVGQILCNFRSESLCFGLSREGLRLVSWMTKHFLTIMCNIIAPLNVGQRVIMQVTLENLICCIGAGAIFDCDCISCCCRFCKRWDGHGQCKRQRGKQCYEFFHVLHWFYVSLLKYFGLFCPHRWRGYF